MRYNFKCLWLYLAQIYKQQLLLPTELTQRYKKMPYCHQQWSKDNTLQTAVQKSIDTYWLICLTCSWLEYSDDVRDTVSSSCRGISHIDMDGQCGERKMILTRLMCVFTHTHTHTRARARKFSQSSSRKSTSYRGKQIDIFTWEFLKSQNEFLNYGPHGFSPVQIFSH